MMLIWEEAVATMNAEGYGFEIGRSGDCFFSVVAGGTAWRAGKKGAETSLCTDYYDPTKAINDLLEKCRAKWPAKHPFDDASLEELLSICRNRGWGSIIIHPGLPSEGTWGAQIGPDSPWSVEFRPADAVRAAMKAKEMDTP
jgi:hypothetical protein